MDVLILNDVDSCSFMDFAKDDSQFQVTMAQVLSDVSSNNMCEEKKRKIGLNK